MIENRVYAAMRGLVEICDCGVTDFLQVENIAIFKTGPFRQINVLSVVSRSIGDIEGDRTAIRGNMRHPKRLIVRAFERRRSSIMSGDGNHVIASRDRSSCSETCRNAK